MVKKLEVVFLMVLCALSMSFAFAQPSIDVDESSPPPAWSKGCQTDYIPDDSTGRSFGSVSYRIL